VTWQSIVEHWLTIICGAVLTLVTNMQMYHSGLSVVRNIKCILTQYMSEET